MTRQLCSKRSTRLNFKEMPILTPGELAVGMFVTVLGEKESDSYDLSGIRQPQYGGWVGIPFQIRAICLPFVMGQVVFKNGGLFGGSSLQSAPLDTRKVQLLQVSEDFYNAYVGIEPKVNSNKTTDSIQ